jgi:hypothetical protein
MYASRVEDNGHSVDLHNPKKKRTDELIFRIRFRERFQSYQKVARFEL